MPEIPILVMPSDLSLTLAVTHSNKTTKLGDGYEQYASVGTNPTVSTYTFTTPSLSTAEYNTIKAQLEPFAATQSPFIWSPDNDVTIPYGTFRISTWQVTPLGPDSWQISGSIKMDPDSSCKSFVGYLNLNLIVGMLESAVAFLKTYTRDTLPLISNSQGVTVNTFQDVNKVGNYLPSSCGTSEGQAILIRGLLSARKKGISTAAKNDALSLATSYSSALLTYFYSSPIPNVPTSQTWLPNYLVNAKSSFTSKGLAATKSVNNGFLEVSVLFINGVGNIPTGTPYWGEKVSDVFKVYTTNSKLLYPNVNSPLVSGTEYSINYWVQDYNLSGIKYKTYSNSSSDNGTRMVTTAETSGKIVLNNSLISGTLNVSYLAYVGPTIAKNSPFGAYPGSRALGASEIVHNFKTSYCLSDCFKLLKEATGNTQWDKAYTSNNFSTNQAAQITNSPYLFKSDSTQTNPLSVPGTRLFLTDYSRGSLSRTVRGWINANIGSIPYAELQNVSVSIDFQDGVTLDVNVNCDNTTILEVIVSTSKNISDTSQQFTFYLPVTASLDAYQSIKPSELIQWSKDTLWHNANSTVPFITYVTSPNTLTYQNQLSTINSLVRCTTKFNINFSIDAPNYISLALLNAGNKIPGIYYRKLGTGSVDYVITDSNNQFFYFDLPDTLGEWTYFNPVDWTNARVGFEQIPGDGPILGVTLLAYTGVTTLEIWFVGEEPNTLQYPCTTYKTSILSRVTTPYNLSVGDVIATNSTSSDLYLNPGVVPFSVKVLGGTIDSWRGLPNIGYQSAFYWYDSGQFDKVQQVLQFIDESQTAYSEQNTASIDGHFEPNYIWPKWDEGVIGSNSNKFAFKGDPNFDWGGYQDRITEDIARYWMAVPTDIKAKNIVMRRLTEIDRVFRLRLGGYPDTQYTEFTYPFALYANPNSAALLVRASLYANIAGGNRAITFRVLKKSNDFLRTEYVSTGNMAGSFTANQVLFTSGGQNYKEYTGFAHGEIMHSLSEVLTLSSQINYPSCSTSVT